ncbi:MAG: family 43 glycosylhydrolase [Treponema sp.]|nr:family 43 glycosylhydrolase [Treponema sp.]
MTVEPGTKFDREYSFWRIELNAVGGSGRLLQIRNGEKMQIAIGYLRGWVGVSILFSTRETPLAVQGKVNENSRIVVSCSGHYLALYVDGRLFDEDWPIGSLNLKDAECRLARGKIEFFDEALQRPVQSEGYIHVTQGWKPEGYNTSVGDCMPFFDGTTLRLYYLFDRRHHTSRWGLGGHQWAQISTTDLKTWRTHPFALRIDKEEEGSLCTGSVILCNNRYYAFYAVRTIDGSPAWLTWAVSDDGIRFTKTGKVFHLSNTYNTRSARDPCVFKDEKGRFHMLVTTSIGKGEEARGCLAHIESADLETWEEKDPFITLDIPEQPECSDYFCYNGFYYLIYSTAALGRYLVSTDPFGPWKAFENNIVIDTSSAVPKSCLWHNERLLFASWVMDVPQWGGSLMLHEAKQRADGSLEFFPLPELRA